jgi:hypothetical protein
VGGYDDEAVTRAALAAKGATGAVATAFIQMTFTSSLAGIALIAFIVISGNSAFIKTL